MIDFIVKLDSGHHPKVLFRRIMNCFNLYNIGGILKKYTIIMFVIILLAIPTVNASQTSQIKDAWSIQLSSGGQTFPQESTIYDDSIYVVGYTDGSLPGYTNYGNQDGFITKINGKGEIEWILQFGTSQRDIAGSVEVDDKGFIYVAGATGGSLEGSSNKGYYDGFVMKLSPDKKIVWISQFGSTMSDFVYDIVVDGKGNVYAIGSTLGSINGASHKGDFDIFIVKLDPNGKMLWVKDVGTFYDDEAYVAGLDSSGNLYLTGYTSGELKHGASQGEEDAVVMKFTPDGNLVWVDQIGSTKRDEGRALVIDDENKALYLLGNTEGLLSKDIYGSHGWLDFYIAKISLTGNALWIKQYASTDESGDYDVEGYYITKAGNGDLLVSGSTDGVLDKSQGEPEDTIPFLMEIDNNGNVKWVQQYANYPGYTASSVIMDKNGNAYLTLGYVLEGSNDTYVLKLTTSNGANTGVSSVSSPKSSDNTKSTATQSTQTQTSGNLNTNIKSYTSLAKSLNWKDPKTLGLLLIVLVIIIAIAKR
jgi:hypothetical protein